MQETIEDNDEDLKDEDNDDNDDDEDDDDDDLTHDQLEVLEFVDLQLRENNDVIHQCAKWIVYPQICEDIIAQAAERQMLEQAAAAEVAERRRLDDARVKANVSISANIIHAKYDRLALISLHTLILLILRFNFRRACLRLLNRTRTLPSNACFCTAHCLFCDLYLFERSIPALRILSIKSQEGHRLSSRTQDFLHYHPPCVCMFPRLISRLCCPTLCGCTVMIGSIAILKYPRVH